MKTNHPLRSALPGRGIGLFLNVGEGALPEMSRRGSRNVLSLLWSPGSCRLSGPRFVVCGRGRSTSGLVGPIALNPEAPPEAPPEAAAGSGCTRTHFSVAPTLSTAFPRHRLAAPQLGRAPHPCGGSRGCSPDPGHRQTCCACWLLGAQLCPSLETFPSQWESLHSKMPRKLSPLPPRGGQSQTDTSRARKPRPLPQGGTRVRTTAQGPAQTPWAAEEPAVPPPGRQAGAARKARPWTERQASTGSGPSR